jgi:hypothetical protein
MESSQLIIWHTCVRPLYCTTAYHNENGIRKKNHKSGKQQAWEKKKHYATCHISNITRAWDVLEQDSATSPDSKVKTSKNKSFSQLAATQLKDLAWGCGEGKGSSLALPW